jgi:hypothetical protein
MESLMALDPDQFAGEILALQEAGHVLNIILTVLKIQDPDIGVHDLPCEGALVKVGAVAPV